MKLVTQENKMIIDEKKILNASKMKNEFYDLLEENNDTLSNNIHSTFIDVIQDEFIKIASHEMKTPVQSILTYSELLHSRPTEHSEEYIEAIYRNALRLQKLSKNLLDITSIENQSLSLKKEKFDMNEVISYTIQDFVTQMQNCGIKFRNKKILFMPGEEALIYADKDRIAQVISNFIDNAFKFTREGNITIEIQLQNNTILVSVKDCGDGISPSMFPRLFSKFSTSSYTGTGLGLYISKNIVKAHEGKIWAKNNVDRGATFSFEIPNIITKNSINYAD